MLRPNYKLHSTMRDQHTRSQYRIGFCQNGCLQRHQSLSRTVELIGRNVRSRHSKLDLWAFAECRRCGVDEPLSIRRITGEQRSLKTCATISVFDDVSDGSGDGRLPRAISNLSAASRAARTESPA